jgi:uncharacterized protein YcbX
MGTLAAIWRHPVKSLGWEGLAQVALSPGACLPGDRAWAVAHGTSEFDPAAPGWVPCRNFIRVTHAPKLAQVGARLDMEGRLHLTHPDAPPLTADPETEAGATAIAAWAAPLAEGARPGPYRLARAPQAMTDADAPYVAVLSLASLRALSQRCGQDLDPRRFRGNLWLDGFVPWEEGDWAGKTLAIGGARLKVIEPIWRCKATEANPETGRYDAPVMARLEAATGDTAFGVYAEVIESALVTCGDTAVLAG